MHRGPLCTRLSARNVLGEKGKKKHGFGVGEEQEVLELFTIVFIFSFFLYNATQQHPPVTVLSQEHVFVLVEGVVEQTYNIKQLRSRLGNVSAENIAPRHVHLNDGHHGQY